VTRPVVTLTRRLPEEVERRLATSFDVRIRVDDMAMSAAEMAQAMRTSDALVPCVSDRVTRDVVAATPRSARIIAQFGAGTNNIDLDAARETGIVVTNTPGVLTEDTADLTIALILMATRRMSEGERELRAGRWTGWRPTHLLGARVRGKTLGIIGFGRIGRAVAERARHGLGMRVIYHNRSPVDAGERTPSGAEPRGSVGEVLVESDVVSLHVPATPATRHLIDSAALSAMRRTAFLVNTARGDVVDESALVEALRSGVIAGAGLDVYEREPMVHPGLLALPNVALIPHLASATVETRVAMGHKVVENLTAYFDGNEPPNLVV
jgi:lactate dehydrogenase-like 2-hydroxyacid dehydrogenase